MLRLIAEKEQTLKEFTDENYAQASFIFRALLKTKEIKVNGKKTAQDMLLRKGDCVQYFLTEKQAAKSAFHTVYEDKNLLVIDKESGVNSEAVYAALVRERGENCRFIHRLDRNTQGLLAFALNAETEKALLNAFKERTVDKRYHALCVGKFPAATGVLTAYLKKNEEKAAVRVFASPTAGAEKIITEYTVLEEKEGLTKAEITLHTGKTHQIRAHLAFIGCPLLGDEKYGDETENKKRNITRQCLVAKRLSFTLSEEFAELNGKIFTSRFEV